MLEKIDKNYARIEYKNSDLMKELSILEKPFSVYGMFYEKEREIVQGVKEGEKKLGSFARIPYNVVKQLSLGYNVMSSTTAGGRIRFSTDSNVIGISVKWNYLVKMATMPMSGYVGFILLEEKEDGTRKSIKTFAPNVDLSRESEGFAEVVDVRKNFNDKQTRMRNYIFFCPLYNDYITDIKVIVEKDAKVDKGLDYKDVKPIVYYGSSITQGGCVSRADNAYSAHIEKWTGVDFINLGVSGSAKGEPLMAEYCASIDSSIFVCDYDHNAPSVEHLQNTHYDFYKTYRNLRPNTPIIFMSKPVFDSDIENTNQRFKVIKATYNKAKQEGDNNVYLVDGRKYYPDKVIGESCHVDFSHPNDLGHYFIAKALYKVIGKLL